MSKTFRRKKSEKRGAKKHRTYKHRIRKHYAFLDRAGAIDAQGNRTDSINRVTTIRDFLNSLPGLEDRLPHLLEPYASTTIARSYVKHRSKYAKSLLPFLKSHHTHALILGTGGAAVAVEWVLQKLNINYLLVSRANAIADSSDAGNTISYEALTTDLLSRYTLIINTSPVGMYPNVDELPSLPYDAITAQHHLYDLIYNPAETLFMKKGLAQGATVQNGLNMLHIQAEESWRIWNTPTPPLENGN